VRYSFTRRYDHLGYGSMGSWRVVAVLPGIFGNHGATWKRFCSHNVILASTRSGVSRLLRTASPGRGFDSRPFRFQVTTLGKLFTYVCLCHQTVWYGAGQGALMACWRRTSHASQTKEESRAQAYAPHRVWHSLPLPSDLHGFMGPPKSTHQTAFRLVQSFSTAMPNRQVLMSNE